NAIDAATPKRSRRVAAPAATTGAATNVTASGATLNGSAAPDGAETTVAFDFGATTSYGGSIAASPSPIPATAKSTSIAGSVGALACGTTYHYRVKAVNSVGTTFGADQAFSTAACPVTASAPLATTGIAASITASSATLAGAVTPDGADTTVAFDLGTSTSYGISVAAAPSPVAATAPSTAVSAGATALACGTTYHYRVKATNSAGTALGLDQSFTTMACGTTTAGAWPWPTWTAGQVIAVPPSSTGSTWYVDGTNGNDTNAGQSPTAAFRTIAKAVSRIAAGDTVLIRKGLYREGIHLGSAPSGTATRPITFGSYGDGEVILDGSARVTGWTLVSGTVWQAQASFKPIGVVVNEVPLRQVPEGQGGSTAPKVGVSAVSSGSGKWYVSGTNLITADFGAVIGSGDPNQADIIVPNGNGAQEHVYWYGVDYLTFKGLTIRGSGSNGLWGYGSHVTVDSCDIKFNGKAAVSFMVDSAATVNSDNAVLYSHAYHNVLLNWPRGNNGYMEAGGGWPGTIVWDTNLRPVARGNIVHENGGEGIISYGTASGHASGSALFEQNVAYDNWSVNIYFDNQPNDVARQNYLFDHPADNNDYLYVGAYPYDSPGKFSVCLMLADEQGSSDATNNYANLRGSQVYDNIMAGCRIGIRDYSEGTTATKYHGLKDTIIANNTIIMGYYAVPNASTYGIYLQDNKSPSGTQRNGNTVIQNNVVYGFNQDSVVFSELAGAQGGLAIDYNDYYSAASKPFGQGYNSVTYYNFAGWQLATPGSDANSRFADPLFNDVTQFRTFGTAVWDYNLANVAAGSPAVATGAPQTYAPAVNFPGVARAGWNIGAF
ncbi:MAG TPA: hypothetical protein VFP36_04475, partial [Usitatibacter sp.]|nr:hypothetical protein [Usitatibacter sp.]